MFFLIKKIFFIIVITVFFLILNTIVYSSKVYSSNIFINGKDYLTLPIHHSKKIQIIEFFSFFCPHCYQFNCIYHFNDLLKKKVPKNVNFIKYHVDFLGGNSGPILTHVWSVAIALSLENKVLIPIFNLVQKKLIVNELILKKIFMQASGISSKEYDKAWNSTLVKSIIKKQNKILQSINLMSVPTLLINGKYIVNPVELNTSSLQNFENNYINIVNFLLKK